MTLDDLYTFALSYFGVLYEWGGNGRGFGYDCSGYIEAILKQAGISFDTRLSADGLYRRFKENGASYRGRGALAFFGTPSRASHVGWMLDSDCMISAAGGGPTCISATQARLLGASVKIQPIYWYKAPPFLGSFMPPYPFAFDVNLKGMKHHDDELPASRGKNV